MNSQSNLSPGESLDFLRLLSKQFPSIQSVCTEIINLEAILDLPKGTEHFISDLHGEYEAVAHILNNASGVIREKIDLLYADTVSEEERSKLATLIYYPITSSPRCGPSMPTTSPPGTMRRWSG